MKSDIEIARETDLRKIKEVATTLGIPREEVQNYGRYIAKVPIHLIDKKQMDQHNLILVTAIINSSPRANCNCKHIQYILIIFLNI